MVCCLLMDLRRVCKSGQRPSFLRGINPSETKTNLENILTKLTDADVKVLLAGMLAPRNMGADYIAEFEAVYPALAEKFDVVYLPFFLEGVAGEPRFDSAYFRLNVSIVSRLRSLPSIGGFSNSIEGSWT